MKIYNNHSQLYRYAKGWYVESDNKMEDLKKVLGDNYCAPTDNDVIDIISHIAFKHIQKSGNPEYRFSNFMKKLNPNSWINKLYGKNDLTFQDRLIDACLSIIGLCMKNEINGELAEPDETILPLTENTKKLIKEK